MISQIIFLPSILLSGIMFSMDLLPEGFEIAGKIFPAAWGYKLLVDPGFQFQSLLPLLVIGIIAVLLCAFILKGHQTE